MNKKKNLLLLFSAIFLVNIIIYFPCINAYFVNDDYNWIQPSRFLDVISSFWGGWGHGALYRPISRVLLYTEYILFNSSPTGYHLVSLFLQTCAVFIFFLVIKSLFSEKNLIVFLPLTVIFFYPYHEVVCWISSQTVLLSTVFLFLSLLYIVKYLDDSLKYLKLFYSILFFILGLMSYEMVVIAPLLIILIVFVKRDSRFLLKKSFLITASSFIALTIIYLIYRKIILAGLPEADAITFSLKNWLEDFLKLIKFQFFQNIFFLVLFLFSLIYTLLVTKDRKAVLFSLAWFFICYIPFFFVNGYTGRFAYLSMFGILFLISLSIIQFYGNYKKFRAAVIIIFLAYIVFNGFKIYQNAGYWHEAGEIAQTIPLQLKSMHSTFPDNSTLIFYNIPLGYKQSGVFLTYFEDVIQRKYINKLNIIHVAHPFNKNFNDSHYKGKPNVYWFKFNPGTRKLVEFHE